MRACLRPQDFEDGRVHLSGMARCSGTAGTSLALGPPWAWTVLQVSPGPATPHLDPACPPWEPLPAGVE